MNKDNPKIISDETLYKKVFIYDSSQADNRFFRQRIVDFLEGQDDGKSFSKFMFQAVWERNAGGQTLKYCDFNEYHQKVNLNAYFYELMVRTIWKAETELKTIQTTR
jgi:hypothetical protein